MSRVYQGIITISSFVMVIPCTRRGALVSCAGSVKQQAATYVPDIKLQKELDALAIVMSQISLIAIKAGLFA